MLEDRRVGNKEIAENLNISDRSTQSVLDNILGMKCVNARLIPKDLNLLQKRLEFAKE